MTEPKELTGIEGLREALNEPGAWEVSVCGMRTNIERWAPYSEWKDWNMQQAGADFRTWRKTPKPEPVRPTEEEVVNALLAGSQVLQYDSGSESLVSTHRKSEVLNSVSSDGCATWWTALPISEAATRVANRAHRGNHFVIIDPQPAQPEPAAEMTAEEATEWLLADGLRRVVSVGPDSTWRKEQDGDRVHCCGSEIYRSELPDCTYRPLGLSTRTQVAFEKELAEANRSVANKQEAIELLRVQLADSNKRCLETGNALGQERAKSAQLAEDNATLRDAMGHALSELAIYDATFPRATNATNWLASALHRTSRTRKS